jgi:hypothetical protein
MTNTITVTESGGQPKTPVSSTFGSADITGVSNPVAAVVVSDNVDFPAPSRRLGPEELYGDLDDSLRSHALTLLQRARLALRQAMKFDPASEFTHFDQEITVARAHIERALNCREIGTGFTAVVNAVNWALANRDAEGLTKKQISVILEALNRVSWSPYLHFDTAMSILDALEESDLNIESPGFALLTAEVDD